jgi:hypothetical protein
MSNSFATQGIKRWEIAFFFFIYNPALVLPSSHVSLPASLESPQVVSHTCLEVFVPPEQLNSHSNLHEAEQPSPSAWLSSWQKFAVLVSVPTVLPSPHIVEENGLRAVHLHLCRHSPPCCTTPALARASYTFSCKEPSSRYVFVCACARV